MKIVRIERKCGKEVLLIPETEAELAAFAELAGRPILASKCVIQLPDGDQTEAVSLQQAEIDGIVCVISLKGDGVLRQSKTGGEATYLPGEPSLEEIARLA
jgi:hypothetical protein